MMYYRHQVYPSAEQPTRHGNFRVNGSLFIEHPLLEIDGVIDYYKTNKSVTTGTIHEA